MEFWRMVTGTTDADMAGVPWPWRVAGALAFIAACVLRRPGRR